MRSHFWKLSSLRTFNCRSTLAPITNGGVNPFDKNVVDVEARVMEEVQQIEHRATMAQLDHKQKD